LNISIIIPAHNEEDCIEQTLKSLVNQTLRPKQVVVVNDNSTDNTKKIVEYYLTNHSWISLANLNTSDQHLPGTKIINAFNNGLAILETNYDVICKFDADLIFPSNYLEQLAIHFNSNEKLGMASGFCYIKENNEWTKENNDRTILTNAIKKIANENIKNINEWRKHNPDCTNAESRKNNIYLKIVSNSMSGATSEESSKNINKIISNVAKEVVINKNM